MKSYTINELNRMNQSLFTKTLGDIFEHSPWVAEGAWASRPFEDKEQLHEAMLNVVKQAHEDRKLKLIRAHPDLGGRLQMSSMSVNEQRQSGLSDLTVEEYAEFQACNTEYTRKFGFPFIIAVKGKSKAMILEAMKYRITLEKEAEKQQALRQIADITRFRINDLIITNNGGDQPMETSTAKRTMHYGKGDVLVYRTFAKPLRVQPVPESTYTGTDNVIFALNVKISVWGDILLTSFTEGDNTSVVATDSMKNFILRHTADFTGNTVEAYLRHMATLFMDKYTHLTGIELSAERIPFDSVRVPLGEDSFADSGLVFRHSRNESGVFTFKMERGETGYEVLGHSALLSNLHLIKVKGSMFAGFVRDEYTTLPESFDRPLYIYLNIGWEYADYEDAVGEGEAKYVASEQISDIAHTLFHQLKSPSIQKLIYDIGLRILERFPQLGKVWFESNNRTWETIVENVPGSEGRVYTEPRPPYGFQGFSLTQSDLEEARNVLEAAASAELK
ncbi:factor-independent urate hydroxylase [Paenibacillus radicis (ex Xue et al. 2023)]|uniref:Urate oxidase n=1 Tax=Paenibacillus radicis (ex Xue et al. 2023) TaxID=2972489 RepID=A0ABT1YJI5_9BACL|nr:urate oxidase [Paenibacillus radicis (ex Xue et al. 2023)]MCR8633322.1 urate oxidase [Paenibacillus radicis (ex Xue et al. 2023)]